MGRIGKFTTDLSINKFQLLMFVKAFKIFPTKTVYMKDYDFFAGQFFYPNSKPLSLLLDLRQTPIPMSLSLRVPFTQKEIFLLFMYVCVSLIGTVGNGMVIRTFHRKQDQPGSRFVLILAVVDCVTSIWIPVTMIGINVNKISDGIYSWPFGKKMCYLRPFEFSSFFASAWLLVAICLERSR